MLAFRVAKREEPDDGPGFGGATAVAGMAAAVAMMAALGAASRRRRP